MVRKITLFLLMFICAITLAQDQPTVVTEEFRSLLIRVDFEDSSTELTPTSSAALDSVAGLFRQTTQHRFEVHGHSCAGAEGQSNTLRFSIQRVEAMVNYLLASGVPVANIVTIVNPVRSETAGEECLHDRRVDIMVVETRVRESIPEPEPVVIPEPTPQPAVIPAPITMAEFRPDPAPVPLSPSLESLALREGKMAVAIYMAGEEPTGARGVHNIMGGELARILSESDVYLAVDRTEAILQQLEREHVYQRSGAVDDDQIKALGQQLGVQYLCISDINPVGRRFYLDTRLVDVVTAEIIRSVTATSSLKSANEMARISREIALELIEPEATRVQRLRRKKIFRYTAIGLDILGAGAIAYGYFENNNVVKQIENNDGPEASRRATIRNTAYITGGALLVTGVSFHIFF
jgi:hypothetical protein